MKKQFLRISTVCIAIIFAYACRKDFKLMGDGNESRTVKEAKDYYSSLIESERSLLALPYTTLKKNANLRKFSRIESMSKIIDWSKARSYYQKGINYALAPVEGQAYSLGNPLFETVRYMLFYQKDGDKMQMNIIEVYSEKGQTLGTDISSSVKISAENMLFGLQTAVSNLNASIIFYDRYYYNRLSFTIKNGAWQKAKIIVENSNKKFVESAVRIQSEGQAGQRAKIDLKNVLNTVSPMAGCTGCETMYIVGVWTDLSTGEVISMTVLGSYNPCASPGGPPPGGAPGTTTATPTPGTSSKTAVNLLVDPCLSGTLASVATAIEQFTQSQQNNENFYIPLVMNFSQSTSMPSYRDGQIAPLSFYNGGAVANIELNANILPSTSREYQAEVMLHEALHAVLELNGIPMSNVTQHPEMANMFRGEISLELQSIFPFLDPDDADALAWEGLHETTAYTSLSTSERDTIQARINRYRNQTSGHYC